jgi:protein phosphatase
MPVTFATATDTGRVRRANEDAVFARPPVFMVADGMGGTQGGEVASSVTAKAFEWFIPPGKGTGEELTKLVQKVNDSIYQLAGSEGRRGMGTTVTAAVLAPDTVCLAHVGDSRAYLWRGGKLSQQTEDHSLVGEMVRQGKISPAEAKEHPQRNIITRALGVEETVKVDIKNVSWQPGDVFLLCSDGLYSMVPDKGIAAILARGDDLDTTAKALIDEANARGGLDNISVVLFCPDGSIPGALAADADTSKLQIPAQNGAAEKRSPRGKTVSREALPEPNRLINRIRHNWMFRTVPGLVLTGLLLSFILLAAAWIGTRQLYFLGVDNGRVAIFQGVPYSLGPWDLYSLHWRSRVKIEDLEPYEQERIAKQELHTLGTAERIVENYSAQARARSEEAIRKAEEASRTTGTNGSSSGTFPSQGISGSSPAGTPSSEVTP